MSTLSGPTYTDARAMLGPFCAEVGSGRAVVKIECYVHGMADYERASLRVQTYDRGTNVDPTDGLYVNGYGPFHGSFVLTPGDEWGTATVDYPTWVVRTDHQAATLRKLAGALYADLISRPGVLAHVAMVRAYHATLDAESAARAESAAEASLTEATRKREAADILAAEMVAAWQATRVG